MFVDRTSIFQPASQAVRLQFQSTWRSSESDTQIGKSSVLAFEDKST